MRLRLFRLLVTLSMMVIFTTCSKDNVDDCFRNAGEIITEERLSSYFKEIYLYNNVNLILESGDKFKIRIEGGENLISSIHTSIDDSILTITNTMKCNWVRSYKHEINAIITCPPLEHIRYDGSGDIITRDRITSDNLEIAVWGGGGSVKADLDCQNLKLSLHYGTVDFNVSGKSVITTIYANSYGPFDCRNLSSNIVFLKNSGTNDCYIHVNHVLAGEITSVGNVYYSGSPYEIDFRSSGKGQLIKLK